MTIDVLIPATRSDLINRCLASLANQQRKSDKVIVVIQHSHKRLQKTIDNFRQTFPLNIEMVYVGKPGAIEAINTGIRVASSDILCFIDDDARARPDWLKLIEGYYKDERIGGVGGRDILHINGNIIEERVKYIGQVSWYGRIVGNHHCMTDRVKEVSHLKGCNMSYRRELLSKIDENLVSKYEMAEPFWELEVGLSVIERGYKIIYDPNILVDHYPATSQLDWNKRWKVGIRNETYIILKHLRFYRKLAYLIFTFLIGRDKNPGIVRFTLKYFKTKNLKNSWSEFSMSVRCKMEGFKTYINREK